MTVLSIAEQIALARRHGFTDQDVPDFCAVVMTESGGRTDAVQPNGLGRGLVQIDLGQHPDVTEAEAFDPDFAADFARRLSRNPSGLGPTNWYGPRDHPDVAAKARAAARSELAKEAPVTDRQIITRAEWGATPASGMAEASYPMSHLWLHHSDTVPADDPAADMRQLQQIAFSRGFSDVSYTFGLHPDGTILEGRDLRYVGAHTASNNSTSLAFVLIGTYTDAPPTDEQIASARWLRDHLIAGGYLTAGTYPTGGHRDAPDNQTGCPGDAAEARLDDFRAPQVDTPTPNPPKEPDVAKVAYPLQVDSGESRRLPILAIAGGFGWTRASVTFASTGVDVRRAVVGPNERPVPGLAPEGIESSRHFSGRGYVDLVAGDEWIEIALDASPVGSLDLYVEAADG